VNGKVFVRKALDVPESIVMAQSLGEAHGWQKQHTTFDLWHLAAAWSLSAGIFLTFDERQGEIAKIFGMVV